MSCYHLSGDTCHPISGDDCSSSSSVSTSSFSPISLSCCHFKCCPLWLLLNSQDGNIRGEVSGFPLKPGLATAAHVHLSVGQAPGFSCLMVGGCGEGLQGTQLIADALTLTQTLRGGGKAWGEESLLDSGSLLFFLLKNYSKSIVLEKLDNYFDSALFLTARGEVTRREKKDAGLPV